MANPFEALMYTKQTGTVSEYADLFISRLIHVPKLAEDYCLGLFLHGLREDIRLRIRSKDATDLFDTMHLAREIEWEIGSVKGYFNTLAPASIQPTGLNTHLGGRRTSWQAPSSRSMASQTGGKYNSAGQSNSSPSSASINQSCGMSLKQITHQECMNRRAKGLCYKCEEPYSPLHKCADKHLHVAIVEDLEEEEPTAANPPALPEIPHVTETDDTEFQNLELSQATSRGFDGPQTMKLKVLVQKSEVLVKVDSGASRRVISSHTVPRLGLQVDTSCIAAV